MSVSIIGPVQASQMAIHVCQTTIVHLTNTVSILALETKYAKRSKTMARVVGTRQLLAATLTRFARAACVKKKVSRANMVSILILIFARVVCAVATKEATAKDGPTLFLLRRSTVVDPVIVVEMKAIVVLVNFVWTVVAGGNATTDAATINPAAILITTATRLPMYVHLENKVVLPMPIVLRTNIVIKASS